MICCKNVVNVTLLIKIRWFYKSLYCCHKCSTRFVKKISSKNLKILLLGDLKNIVAENLKYMMNEGTLKKAILKK